MTSPKFFGTDKLCVLVPSRSRPHNVAQVVEAWYKTGAFGVAELVWCLDADDPTLDQYQEELSKHVQVHRVVGEVWQPLVPKLNRWAVQAAKTYAVVAFCGDDHVPRTPLWAHQLLKEGVLRKPSIVYGRDGHHNQELPTWWSMSSDVVTALGAMVPSQVQHLFCDNVVKLLGSKSETLVYLDHVEIEHCHPLNGKAQSDDQYARVNRPEQYARDQAAALNWANSGGLDEAVEKLKALRQP